MRGACVPGPWSGTVGSAGAPAGDKGRGAGLVDEGWRRAGDGVAVPGAGGARLPSPPHCVGLPNPGPREVVMGEGREASVPGVGGHADPAGTAGRAPLLLRGSAKTRAFPPQQPLAPAGPAPSRGRPGRRPRRGEPCASDPVPSSCLSLSRRGGSYTSVCALSET